jgi:predicted ATPase
VNRSFKLTKVIRSTRYNKSSLVFGRAFEQNEITTFSVVIGINGVGKSRLLGEIARSFVLLADQKRDRQGSLLLVRNFPFHTLEYTFNDSSYALIEREGLLECWKDSVRCELDDLELPRKVIGLTISPFDKFPLPPRILDDDDEDRSEIFAYLGSRTRGGHASLRSLLFNILENLGQAAEAPDARRGRIEHIFEFLGYQPHVQFRYSRRFTADFVESLDSPELFDKFLQARHIPQYSRVHRLTSKRPQLRRQVARAMHDLLSVPGSRGFLELDANVSSGGISFSHPRIVNSLKLLRRLGLLSLHSVNVLHNSGASIDLLEASSGELSILTAFLGLAAAIEDGSLILIDEPEISLHPEWQQKYLDLLSGAFETYQGCHFILATHSPLIVADAPPDVSNIISLDNRGVPASIEDLAGQSSDFILANAFRVVSEKNYYLRDQLAKALRLATRGKTQSEEYRKIVYRLQDLTKLIESHSELKPVIAALNEGLNVKGLSHD